tara:strand:- start:5238 stop:6644 length:1407 start_codon:yes stop_codon:yes gene_type:complete
MSLTRATDKIIGDSNGNLNLSGIVTASSFSGSGANLTGIDATAIKHTDGNVKVQAINTGANLTGNLSVSGNLGVGGVLTYEDVTNIDSVGVITARGGIKIGPTAGVAGTFFADGSYITAGIITATTFHGSGANLTSLPAQVTIANNGDNRVITGGSGVNLNGEANLSFDGSILNINASVPSLKLTDSDGGPCFHEIKGPGNGDLRISCDVGNTSSSGSEIQFLIHDAEKAKIDSSGALTSIASNNGQIAHKFQNTDTTSSSSAMTLEHWFNFNRTGGGMDFSAARIVAGKEREWVGAASNQDGFLAFYTALNESISEKVRITSQGYLTKPQTPFFSAYGTASNQTYNQDTDITFENTSQNIGGHFKTTSGTGQYQRFTAPVEGVYLFSFGFFPNSASSCRIALAVNGGVQTNPYISGCFSNWGTGQPAPMGTQMLKLGVGSYVTVRVTHGTLSNTYDGHTGFQGVLLG